MSLYGYRKPADLPGALSVFPLTGAVLLPRSSLPLNIFEPRYLNMVDDALASDRLIGMIQPAGAGPAPELMQIGCAGRLTAFAETGDGRYLITLTGVCRFRVAQELPQAHPYRRVTPDWAPFAHDLVDQMPDPTIDRERMIRAMRRYAQAIGVSVDWEQVDATPSEALIDVATQICPFEPIEKQTLLEARSHNERAGALIMLLELNSAGAGPPDRSRMQ
jgi:hypothetical protein